MQEHVEAGLGGRPEVGVRGLLQLTDEEPHAHLTLEAQEAARAAFAPAEECRDGMLNLRYKFKCVIVARCALKTQLSPSLRFLKACNQVPITLTNVDAVLASSECQARQMYLHSSRCKRTVVGSCRQG